MSNFIKHALTEFKALGYIPLKEKQEDGPNKWIQENVLELLKVFDKQGHSGFSANFCIKYFTKLANFEPLSPLTGKDEEWNQMHDGAWQNIRCSHFLKNKMKLLHII